MYWSWSCMWRKARETLNRKGRQRKGEELCQVHGYKDAASLNNTSHIIRNNLFNTAFTSGGQRALNGGRLQQNGAHPEGTPGQHGTTLCIHQCIYHCSYQCIYQARHVRGVTETNVAGRRDTEGSVPDQYMSGPFPITSRMVPWHPDPGVQEALGHRHAWRHPDVYPQLRRRPPGSTPAGVGWRDKARGVVLMVLASLWQSRKRRGVPRSAPLPPSTALALAGHRQRRANLGTKYGRREGTKDGW